MNGFDTSDYIDGRLVDDLWHKLFPDGTATIEFALSVQLGSKFGAIMPTDRQDPVFDLHGMAMDIMLPFRWNMDAIRKDFSCNGVDYESIQIIREKTSGLLKTNQTNREEKPRRPLGDITNSSSTIPAHASHIERKSRTLKKHIRETSEAEHCVFCYNNGTTPQNYKSHLCRDERGLVSCPALQKMICPFCKATGRYAHTPKYCPQKPILTPEDCEAIERKAQACRRSFAGNPMQTSKFKLSFTPKIYMR